VLKLINETLPALSTGWADGLLGHCAGQWLSALVLFARFLD